MGLTSLERMEDFIAINRRNYELYRDELAGLPGLTVMTYDEQDRPNYQYVILEICEKEATLRRDELLAVLLAENILARRYFYPGCHKMEPYASSPMNQSVDLPNTERLVHSLLCLPTGSSVAQDEVRRVSQIIRLALRNSDSIRLQLAMH
ncbi:dTDP-4-amino-4,6-dideoxy-D-glucose transaminase [compost metagenome]